VVSQGGCALRSEGRMRPGAKAETRANGHARLDVTPPLPSTPNYFHTSPRIPIANYPAARVARVRTFAWERIAPAFECDWQALKPCVPSPCRPPPFCFFFFFVALAARYRPGASPRYVGRATLGIQRSASRGCVWA
jgi:hypothetical protein